MARQDVKPASRVCDCGQPLPPSMMLCRQCSETLRWLLSEMPALMDDLDITRSRQDRLGSGNVDSRPSSVDKPLFWKQTASEAEAILGTVLLFRVRALLASRGVSMLPMSAAANLRGCANLLLLNIDWLRQTEDAPEFLDELSDAVKKVRAVIDRAPDQWYAGRCGHVYTDEDGTTLVCKEDLYALVGAEFVRCRVCMTDYDVEERRRFLLNAAYDEVATAHELSAALAPLGQPVTVSMIENYVRTGRLHALSRSPKGVPLYRVGDVVDAFLAVAQERADRAAKAAEKRKAKRKRDTSQGTLAEVSDGA